MMPDRKRLEDSLDIQALLARIARNTDYGSVEEYLANFTEDAVIEIEGRPTRAGRNALQAAAVQGRAAGNIGPGSRKYHIVVPGELVVEGDNARSESRFIFVGHLDEGVQVGAVGRYHDVALLTDVGWKLCRRFIEFG
jgi:hypothetical protein